MKILVVAPCYYPAVSYGGPVTAIHQMNKTLVKNGVEVTVYTTNANGPQTLDVPIGEDVDVDGVLVRYFPITNPKKYFYAPALTRALKENLPNFDCVHINWLYVFTTLITSRLCIKMGIPYMLTPHGMLDSYSIKLKGFLKKKLYLSLVEKKHLLNAECIHYSSQGEENEVAIKGWGGRSIVVPNGIDTSVMDAAYDESKIYEKYPELLGKKLVLSMGRLNYIKGLELLLQAWPIVVKDFDDAHLVIAGPDSDGYMDKLKVLAGDVGVEKQVTFTGMVVGNEKTTLFKESNVFVSSSYLESFGMAIVEAMSSSLPVVITDRVNIKPEIESSKAGLVAICEPQDIALKIIRLLENDEESRRMGLRGKKLVEKKFELESVSKQMISIYEQVSKGTLKKGLLKSLTTN